MQLLTILTLIYVAVLVVALAISLIASWIYLRRIAGTLGEVRAALETVSQQTAPLEDLIENVDAAFTRPAENLQTAQEKLEAANEHLDALVRQSETADLPR